MRRRVLRYIATSRKKVMIEALVNASIYVIVSRR